MKNKPFFRSFLTLLFALICMGGVSVTAYAQGNDIPTDDSGVIVETEPQPLTPEGNMSLVDDISGEASGDKQFIVVKSKGGNYFYIVIDHAAEGENTVHFLNQVDEADLMAIIGEEETTAPAVCTCTDKCVAGAINTHLPGMLCDDERVYGRRRTDRAGTARRTAGKAKQKYRRFAYLPCGGSSWRWRCALLL